MLFRSLDVFASGLNQLVGDVLEEPEQHAQYEDRKVLVKSHDWDGIADTYFAHLVFVFSQSVYNRRPGKARASLV